MKSAGTTSQPQSLSQMNVLGANQGDAEQQRQQQQCTNASRIRGGGKGKECFLAIFGCFLCFECCEGCCECVGDIICCPCEVCC